MKKITVPCKKKTNNCDIHVNQQGGLYLTAVHFQLLTNVNEEVESLGKPTKFFDIFETEKHSVNNNDEQDHRNNSWVILSVSKFLFSVVVCVGSRGTGNGSPCIVIIN